MVRADVFELKRKTAKLFRSRCYICQRKFGKGFTFHHKWYNVGEKTYRDFTDPNEYNLYIIELVKHNPKQFLLLCRKHHFAIETMKKYRKDTLRRLLRAVKMSR